MRLRARAREGASGGARPPRPPGSSRDRSPFAAARAPGRRATVEARASTRARRRYPDRRESTPPRPRRPAHARAARTAGSLDLGGLELGERVVAIVRELVERGARADAAEARD